MLFMSIESLDHFSLKLLFRVQITKNDLTILLSYVAIFFFFNAINVTNCNTNNNNNNNYFFAKYFNDNNNIRKVIFLLKKMITPNKIHIN